MCRLGANSFMGVSRVSLSSDFSALVVDDHPLVARGIADYLRLHCGFVRVEALSNEADLWANIQAFGAPALALLDFWLPGGTALPVLTRLRTECPETRLLVVSGDADPAIHAKLRALGVDGFLLKKAEPALFGEAVASVMRGEGWFDVAAASSLSASEEHHLPLSAAELGLTPRQGEVLALMLKGLPNKRVATSLGLTEQTVKEHVSSILERLGARNRVELIMRLSGKRIDV